MNSKYQCPSCMKEMTAIEYIAYLQRELAKVQAELQAEKNKFKPLPSTKTTTPFWPSIGTATWNANDTISGNTKVRFWIPNA